MATLPVRDGNGDLVNIDIPEDVSTGAKQDAAKTVLDNILTALGLQPTAAGQVATNTKLDSILAKIIAAPATEATVAAILAKIIAAPSTEAKQDLLYSLFGGGTAPTAVTGTFVAAGNSTHFIPLPRRAINVTLSGTFSATVQVQVSHDGGTVYVPVTAGGISYSDTTIPGSSQYEDTDPTARYRLACTAYASGTVTYRISQ